MDLFNHSHNSNSANSPLSPLAERLRPKTSAEVQGQSHLLKPQSWFAKMLDHKVPQSLILWGPPGCGKTTLARILMAAWSMPSVSVNAVETGSKALKEIGEAAREKRRVFTERTTLFVDEVHRLNRGCQDVLLPFLESGDLVLIGATTENPSHALNPALISRCRVAELKALTSEDLLAVLERALEPYSLTSGQVFSPEAKDFLINWADGDARKLIGEIELILSSADLSAGVLDGERLQELLSDRTLAYDAQGQFHYDLISAFIKSVRGSDADAALYYLARMVKGGENVEFLARRLMILASEDIGNADPRGLSVAVAAAEAVKWVGLPEAGLILAQATTYLASAPKSNRSYLAWNKAVAEVERSGNLPVPLALRSSKTQFSRQQGYGQGYKYPHDHPKAWVQQDYLPTELAGSERGIFYEPASLGFEKSILEYRKWIREN